MFFATSATEPSTLSILEKLVLVSWQELAHGFQILHTHLVNVNVEGANQERLAATVLSYQLEPPQRITLLASVGTKRVLLQALKDVLFSAVAGRACKSEAERKILKQHLRLV